MLYSFAISRLLLLSALIVNTCFSVSLEVQHFSHLWSQEYALHFLTLSCALSLAVHINKCSGLQQAGVSHLWHTCNQYGISQLCILQENLDVRIHLLFIVIIPYHLCVLCHFHNQQGVHTLVMLSQFLSIFSQNLSIHLQWCHFLSSTDNIFHLVNLW